MTDWTNLPLVEAGRTLDGLVAEHVAGYHREPVPPDGSGEHGGNDVLVPPGQTIERMPFTLPPKGPVGLPYFARLYSTKCEEALYLLEQHFAPPKHFTRLVLTETGNWRCDIELRGGDGPVISAAAETVPLAICLAALEAKGMSALEIEAHFVPF